MARPWKAARGTRLPCGASPTLRTSDNNGKGFQHPPCAQAGIKSAETTPRLELINLRVVPSRAKLFDACHVEETTDLRLFERLL